MEIETYERKLQIGQLKKKEILFALELDHSLICLLTYFSWN